VSTKVRGGPRHDDDVTLAGADLAVATRAQVCLARFVRLHPPDLDVVIVGAGHDHTR